MKKSIYLVMGLMVLFLFVGTTPSLAAEKIGFINLQEIIQTSNAGKQAAEEFKKIYQKKQESVRSLEAEIKKMKDELEKQGAMMTPSVRSDKETAYQRRLRDYQLMVEDTNKELQKRDQEYSQKMIPEILKAVRAIGEREKYTMILDYGTMPLPYHDKAADITKTVIEEYNKQKAGK